MCFQNLNPSFLIIALFFISFCSSQEIAFTGVVLDSSQNPLIDANVTAIPVDDKLEVRYSTTNSLGYFELILMKKRSYKIIISHLTHFTKKIDISTTHVIQNPIILIERTEKLDEVVLNYKTPIVVKKDTIIYDTNAFVSGEERKLRDVLKKLPGVKVDHEGNIKVKGKKVTKVMVEDKTFFTGNSRLAVNNIPADAVDQIEILDNYNEVGFLKGLKDSDQMALNIRLKKNKKKFTFGDIEVGAGIKDRYLAHPTLFYYSPNTNLNFIGDLNNIGEKSFTLSDYLEFEGGFGKLMGDLKGYFDLFNDDFSKYLANTDFKENTNQFGAFNLRQSITSKTDLNTYIIANGSNTETETRILNNYSNNNDPFSENRSTSQSQNNFFVIGKLTLDHEPSNSADLSANTFIKLSNNNANGSLVTTNPFQNNTFQTLGTLDAINLKQNFEYSKKFSKKQTISLETTLDHKKTKPNTNWLTNVPFLNNLIPLQDDSIFDVFQQIETQNISFDFIFKDYWVLNNLNHLYTTLGTNLVSENFTSLEEQRLGNGTINNFALNNFGNDLSYNFNDIFLGLEYKNLTGIFTTKAGLFYHNYSWKNEQLGNTISKSTNLLLPQFNVEAEFNSSEKLNFKYQVKANFPNSRKLIGNFLLSNFNQVFRGNRSLANEKYHSLSVNYYKFSLFRGLNLNAAISYNKKTQSIKNTTEFQGIEQFRTLTMFNLPENSVTGQFSFGKKVNAVKFGFETSGSYNEFFQIVNNNTSKNISKRFSTTGKIETFFKKAPNLELGYTYTPSTFITNFSTSNFTNNELFANLNYTFLEDFTLKSDYSRVDYQNQNEGILNIFDIANASLFYQKEDSAWGFEVEATNLFNTQFKRSNSFSDFLISDQTTFILPRIILFKISYKL